MNNKKPRSSLKKVTLDEVDPVRPVSRRISFSGKKFIREFDTTEKARDYDNSYEISDHITGDDSSGQSHHVTGTSALQVTTHISLADEMDKENMPVPMISTSVRESTISSEYDQLHRNEFTLQLQTSVNLTMMPHELLKNHPLESLAFDSLSLEDAERDKLRESIFKIPVNDKTMDLVPHKMIYDKMDPKTPERKQVEKTMLTPTEISCVDPSEKDVKQKTVLFANNNISCDFSDIDPQQIVIDPPAQQTTYESIEMEERDSLNYLPDNSTCSPLIPLDVISENGISRKLNFRQLNEALNSGRIQLFPHGPRTPTTDRTAKPKRFWHGVEQQPIEEDLPLRETIKPRGTLNFNESMMMSPIPQPIPADEPVRMKSLADVKRNNRFSQADELMLDNTNFLAHAKIGDETQSRNSSKCASRRETTYDNTAMELDDLEKQEAAVAAALEKATRRPTLQRMPSMDEDDLIPSASQNLIKNATTAPVQLQDNKAHIKEEQTNHRKDDMEEEYVIRRQTLHLTEAIDEDMPSPRKDFYPSSLATQVQQQKESRRQTFHIAEDIDEDMPSPRQNKHSNSVKEQTSRRRQTLHVEEPIEEDKPQMELNPQPNETQWKHAVEKVSEQQAGKAGRRQTLHFSEAIDEDAQSPAKDLHSKSKDPSVRQQTECRRQTFHFAEDIEDVSMIADNELPPVESKISRRRQTLHMAEAIEEDLVGGHKELRSQPEQQWRSRRQTIQEQEPIKEDTPKPGAPTALQDYKIRRQTLHVSEDIEVEIGKPEQIASATKKPQVESGTPPVEQQSRRRRETLLMSESIEEEPSALKDLQPTSIAAPVAQQINRDRKTLHLEEAIEEDLTGLKPQQPSAPEEQKNRRQTIQKPEPIEEDKTNTAAPAMMQHSNIRRQTVHFSTTIIEEDIVRPQEKAAPVEQQSNRRRQTLHMAECIEEDSLSLQSKSVASTEDQRKAINEESMMDFQATPNKPKQNSMETNSKHSVKPRQTYYLEEPIQEDIDGALPNIEQVKKPRQTLILSEAINDDASCFDLGSSSTQQQPNKMNLNESTVPITKMTSNKSRMTFLETFEADSNNSSSDKAVENNADQSQSDSAEWLNKMKTKLRKTLVKDELCKSVLKQSSMETPKRNKTQRNCVQLTPGYSMIDFENNEEMCNHETPAATKAAKTIYQPVDMELDMDISNCGTPIEPLKPSSLFNSKRLSGNLTPNLPQPKKRSMQPSIEPEDQNSSRIHLDTVRRDEEEATPTARNRSRIPVLCKTINPNSPWRETEQLDGTVQMVRAQMMRQTSSIFDAEGIYPTEVKTQPETAGTYEDNPITISDVSSHFAAQKELAKRSEEPKNTSSNSRSSNENSNKSYARKHKKFLNLSGDTEIFHAAEVIDLESDDNEIDKTQLNLVSTLLDEEEEEDDEDPKYQPQLDQELETCLVQLDPPVAAGTVDACKKCTHCRRSINETLIRTSESFALPNWSGLEQGFQRLKRLRQQPSLEDVHNYWELKKLARYSNASDNVNETILNPMDNEAQLTLSEMLQIFSNNLQECKKKFPEPMLAEPYVKRLTDKLRVQGSRWIFDSELQCDRQYIISHREISTFRIVINYEPLDIMETDIRVRSIKSMTATCILKENWSAYESLMDFQVRLRLPLNLLNLLDGNDVDDVVRFLQHIDTICSETTKMCNDLHLVLLSKQARLLRQPNRIVVQKIVRSVIQEEDEAYGRLERMIFLIEIGNLEQISFKDILKPPLYQFDEKIQFLPKGIEFLETFLQNPEQYFKPNN